jgi:hypothetical protein
VDSGGAVLPPFRRAERLKKPNMLNGVVNAKGFLVCLLGATLAAIVIAACGGDDSGGSGERLIAAADEICSEDAERSIEISNDARPLDGPDATVGYLSELRSSREMTVSELSELEAPADLTDDYEAYLEGRREAAGAIDAGIDAARAGDQEAFIEARDRGEELAGAYEKIGKRIGFGACAAILPSDQAELARKNLTEAATSADPDRVCDLLATDEYIEDRFGSREECVGAQEEQQGAQVEVEITDLSGIEDVSARATLEFVDQNGGRPRFDVNAVYEDGTFKVDAVAPASGEGAANGPTENNGGKQQN